MAFTDESNVRGHLGGIDTTSVPSASVLQAIEEAHQDLMRDLRSEYAGSEDPVLKQAETELASAFLLRMLASRFAVEEAEVHTPMLKLLGGKKLEDLLRRAHEEERAARGRVQPFVETPPEGFAFGLVEGSASSDEGE